MAPKTSMHDMHSVSHIGRLEQTLTVSFGHQSAWCGVMPADTFMYVVKQIPAFFLRYAILEDSTGASLVELPIDDDVCFGAMHDVSRLLLVL